MAHSTTVTCAASAVHARLEVVANLDRNLPKNFQVYPFSHPISFAEIDILSNNMMYCT